MKHESSLRVPGWSPGGCFLVDKSCEISGRVSSQSSIESETSVENDAGSVHDNHGPLIIFFCYWLRQLDELAT